VEPKPLRCSACKKLFYKPVAARMTTMTFENDSRPLCFHKHGGAKGPLFPMVCVPIAHAIRLRLRPTTLSVRLSQSRPKIGTRFLYSNFCYCLEDDNRNSPFCFLLLGNVCYYIFLIVSLYSRMHPHFVGDPAPYNIHVFRCVSKWNAYRFAFLHTVCSETASATHSRKITTDCLTE
jgi:hypothetical protein